MRRHVISESALQEIEGALARFHENREIFREGDNPIVSTFSLPRQHAAKHYPYLIRLFGAPNGLCLSITENKHIKAVKEPWRRSSRYQALGQMLLTNQRLNKIAAAWVDFRARNMLNETCLSSAISVLGLFPIRTMYTILSSSIHLAQTTGGESTHGEINNMNDVGDGTAITHTASIQGDNNVPVPDNAATDLCVHVKLAWNPRKFIIIAHSFQADALSKSILECRRPRMLTGLGEELGITNLIDLTHRFLFGQHFPGDQRDASQIPLSKCPWYNGRIRVFNSACTRFYAPSDLSGVRNGSSLWSYPIISYHP